MQPEARHRRATSLHWDMEHLGYYFHDSDLTHTEGFELWEYLHRDHPLWQES